MWCYVGVILFLETKQPNLRLPSSAFWKPFAVPIALVTPRKLGMAFTRLDGDEWTLAKAIKNVSLWRGAPTKLTDVLVRAEIGAFTVKLFSLPQVGNKPGSKGSQASSRWVFQRAARQRNEERARSSH